MGRAMGPFKSLDEAAIIRRLFSRRLHVLTVTVRNTSKLFPETLDESEPPVSRVSEKDGSLLTMKQSKPL